MILDRPDEPGKKYALTFTVLVHVGLVAALFLGVQWKRSQPEIMEVELWSSRPMPAQVVPPPPPPPEVKPEPKPIPKVEPKPEPLPPKKPDIAVKEEKEAGAEEAGTQARTAEARAKTAAAAQVRFQQGTGARDFRPEAAPEYATTGQCGCGRSRAAGIVEQEGPGRLRQQDPHEGAR